ncbi:MAG: hypothetical protein DWQ29_20645 [Planctomycetota bacterium]|nr:MAG: hypothetical protein DWQ29_20645 [Planctomycetota bacterium]
MRAEKVPLRPLSSVLEEVPGRSARPRRRTAAQLQQELKSRPAAEHDPASSSIAEDCGMARLARRSGRLTRRMLLWGGTGALIASLSFLRAANVSRVPPPLETAGEYEVARVVDGDTLLLETGHRVRLLGVDTPETKHPHRPAEPFGQAAAQFTRRAVEGRIVRLEFDRHRVDRYGRTLAFVRLGETLLNEELIREGFSRAETGFPFRSDYQRRFQEAESSARQQRLGIWSTDHFK